MSDTSKRKVVVKYEGRGLLGGFAIGFILGALVSGPQLRNWPLWHSLVVVVVLGGGAIGAFLGYLAIWIAAGSAAGLLLAPVLATAGRATVAMAVEVEAAMLSPERSNSALLSDASSSLRFACGAAKRER